MTIQPPLGRRGFLVNGAAVAGGFSLGFSFSYGSAQAADVQEINAWVVIHPDDKVVIRVVRTEMGQGTLTGLCQLIAEELECDWSKVTPEFPTPGENLKRHRIWKNFSTGGSRGIRESNDYVRQGGAAARMMLIDAAATEWKVAASECTAAERDRQNGPHAFGVGANRQPRGKGGDSGVVVNRRHVRPSVGADRDARSCRPRPRSTTCTLSISRHGC
jgi:CO/xanthine dehydrogenase Mo-binding subunit